jgi:HEAT repeat protein
VRLAASFAAVRLGVRNEARTLADALSDSPDENMRADAAYLIGRLHDHQALRRLKLAATREKSTKVLVHICAAMAELGDKDGLDALIQFSQGDLIARLVALQSLADLGDERATDALKFALNDQRSYLQMRLIAARGLGRLGSEAGYKTAADAIHYVSKDENDTMRVRTLAALALGEMHDARALGLLMVLAEDQSDMRVQVAAAYAISRIAGSSPLATQVP